MKKFTYSLLIILIPILSQAQNGLENILVEKYYISDANDTNVNIDGGVLPVGSVTYRIYADMLPGYKFQAGYGVPDHELRIETTTLFFNNEDRGATSPTYTKSQAANNTVMLDSWLSVGAACNGNFGILKSSDDGNANIVNSDGVLQNADPDAGIPLTTQDGLIAGTPEPVTAVGITTEIAIFDAQNDGSNGPLFSTMNGSWASLNGSTGPDSIDNKVLIAQITTDGIFSFELNIQIGTPSGGVENYVARNPIGSEIQIPSLIYSSFSTSIVKTPVQQSESNFILYPNPVKDIATLRIDKVNNVTNGSYSIFNLSGKILMKKELGLVSEGQSIEVNLSDLASGIYFIELMCGDASSYSRFVKN